MIAAVVFALPLLMRPKTWRVPSGPFGEADSREEELTQQYLRAKERGRGRDARSPLHIPWAGWKDIIWRTVKQISQNRLLAIAAGVVFYGLLALFPAVTALVSLYGIFQNAATIGGRLSFLSSMMPASAYSIVQEQIARIVAKGDARLSFAFIFSFGLAIWSANAGMKSLIDALNVVYEEDEKRSFLVLNVVSLVFTIAAVACMLTAVAAVVVTPLILADIGLGAVAQSLIRFATWPALVVIMLFGLAVLYRYGPSRREARWQWLTVGAVVASISWLLGSVALSYYLDRFADYSSTYGSLGAVIGTMMWMWMSAIVILFGAELNSEIEHQTAVDSTVGSEKPLGTRGATMADTIGEAQYSERG
jgi:membrane protein